MVKSETTARKPWMVKRYVPSLARFWNSSVKSVKPYALGRGLLISGLEVILGDRTAMYVQLKMTDRRD